MATLMHRTPIKFMYYSLLIDMSALESGKRFAFFPFSFFVCISRFQASVGLHDVALVPCQRLLFHSVQARLAAD